MIREAVLTDNSRLVELLEKYWEEADCKKLSFDSSTAYATFYNGIIDESRDVSVLVENNSIVGFTHSFITNTGFSKDLILECDILYVLPEYRIGHNGIKLIKNLTKLAKRSGAKYVYLGVASGIHTDRTSLLYQKLGYVEIGKDFRLELG